MHTNQKKFLFSRDTIKLLVIVLFAFLCPTIEASEVFEKATGKQEPKWMTVTGHSLNDTDQTAMRDYYKALTNKAPYKTLNEFWTTFYIFANHPESECTDQWIKDWAHFTKTPDHAYYVIVKTKHLGYASDLGLAVGKGNGIDLRQSWGTLAHFNNTVYKLRDQFKIDDSIIYASASGFLNFATKLLTVQENLQKIVRESTSKNNKDCPLKNNHYTTSFYQFIDQLRSAIDPQSGWFTTGIATFEKESKALWENETTTLAQTMRALNEAFVDGMRRVVKQYDILLTQAEEKDRQETAELQAANWWKKLTMITAATISSAVLLYVIGDFVFSKGFLSRFTTKAPQQINGTSFIAPIRTLNLVNPIGEIPLYNLTAIIKN